MEYAVKQGFGPKHVKEYFVGQTDGDTLSSIIAGPFESESQCRQALDALRPLYFSPLCVVGGHLTRLYA
jgi:hypothetical protein